MISLLWLVVMQVLLAFIINISNETSFATKYSFKLANYTWTTALSAEEPPFDSSYIFLLLRKGNGNVCSFQYLASLNCILCNITWSILFNKITTSLKDFVGKKNANHSHQYVLNEVQHFKFRCSILERNWELDRR